jgi:cell division protein FtsB
MAKNRKNQTAAVQFAPVLKVVLICSLICGSAVGYVWQKNEIYRLGQQIRQRESRLAQLDRDNQRLGDQIAILHSPVMLDQRAKELNLGLVPAQPSQVVRLSEVGLAGAADGMRQRELVQRPSDDVMQ